MNGMAEANKLLKKAVKGTYKESNECTKATSPEDSQQHKNI